jgi:hypothetical protein
MPQHQYVIDPRTGEVDMAAYEAEGHKGSLCFVCGAHVCAASCTSHRGRLIPLDVAQCRGAETTFFVVYEASTYTSLSFHLSKVGAQSYVSKRLEKDRSSGKVHQYVDPYPIVEEPLCL